MKQKKPRMHWLKLWTRGWLEGSIRFDLTPAQRSVFLDLVAMARESRNPPWVQANETTAYPYSWLANKLNVSLELLEGTLVVCKTQGRISENSNGIKVLKFDYYQDREQQLNRQKSQQKGPTLFETTEQAPQDQTDTNLAKIASLYENNIGALTPIIAEALKDISAKYPLEWFEEAAKEACQANVRRLSYISSILERWQIEGFKTPKPGGKSKFPKGELPTTKDLEEDWKV